jgi:hypothetical protein
MDMSFEFLLLTQYVAEKNLLVKRRGHPKMEEQHDDDLENASSTDKAQADILHVVRCLLDARNQLGDKPKPKHKRLFEALTGALYGCSSALKELGGWTAEEILAFGEESLRERPFEPSEWFNEIFDEAVSVLPANKRGYITKLNGKPLTKGALTGFQLGDARRLFRYRADQRGKDPTQAEIDDALWDTLENGALPQLYKPTQA